MFFSFWVLFSGFPGNVGGGSGRYTVEYTYDALGKRIKKAGLVSVS